MVVNESIIGNVAGSALHFLKNLIYFLAPAAPNKGIQRSARSGRPLMSGLWIPHVRLPAAEQKVRGPINPIGNEMNYLIKLQQVMNTYRLLNIWSSYCKIS